jgi:NADH-quinone oxidoreductase subunit L
MNEQELLLVLTVGLPLVAVVVIAVLAWFGDVLGEGLVGSVVGAAFTGSAIAVSACIAILAFSGFTEVRVDAGPWLPGAGHSIHWEMLGDRLSLPVALFVAVLVGLIGAFSRRYLHREPGFVRFYFLLSLFGFGAELVVLAGNLDLLFFGWELVGITSALLIAFFDERRSPAQHGLWAFSVYRICDVGLLTAVLLLHHAAGSVAITDSEGQPFGALPIPGSAGATASAGLLLLWASMGKSAQVPLGGWLPRAMEGPTPSSAIFYGAISIHLGPYLLLRAAPLLEAVPWVGWTVASVGLLTAAHGSFVGRVQTDIKSVLAYASMTQVGLIVAEIGLGLRWLPLVHMLGHATVRSLEILRSPSLLHDDQHLEDAIGRQIPRVPWHFEMIFPASLRPWFYRHALERGAFDSLLRDHVVGRTLGTVRRMLAGAAKEAGR